jgi:hypothetical protein
MRGTERARPAPRYVAAWFKSEEEILTAARAARAGGYAIRDAYTPYPVHGLDDAVGLRRSRLTRIALAGGIAGLGFALLLQLWVSLSDWPMNIGGKPEAPLPLFVPVSFELTVLISGLSTVAAFLIISRLRPAAKLPLFQGATDDRFVLVLDQRDGADDPAGARKVLESNHAVAVLEGVRS